MYLKCFTLGNKVGKEKRRKQWERKGKRACGGKTGEKKGK